MSLGNIHGSQSVLNDCCVVVRTYRSSISSVNVPARIEQALSLIICSFRTTTYLRGKQYSSVHLTLHVQREKLENNECRNQNSNLSVISSQTNIHKKPYYLKNVLLENNLLGKIIKNTILFKQSGIRH